MHRPEPRFARSVSLALFAFLAACGGQAPDREYVPFEANYPSAPPHDTGGPPTPPPVPPVLPTAAIFRPDAFPHARTAFFGSFPSDVVLFEDTVFTNDADQVESDGALVVPVDVSGTAPVPSTRFTPCRVRPSDLVDSAGGHGTTPIGFGSYLNEIAIVDERLGLVLANAGGSDSTPTLSNVVAFDPVTGVVRQVVDLAHAVAPGAYVDSTGAAVPGGTFVQSSAEGLEFVPTEAGRGRLYVAMSNIVFNPPSYGAVKYPGTIQVFDVEIGAGLPVTPRPTAGFATETHLCAGYNPVSIQAFSPGVGATGRRLLVTVAGTTGYDLAGNLVPVTEASVEAYEGADGTFLGTFRLGLAAPSAIRPALGRDALGHHVAFLPSSTTGRLYLLLLDGLFTPEIDPAHLAVLRGPNNGIPIAAAEAGTAGGNLTGVGLSPDGRTLAVAGFGNLFAFPTPKPGRLFLLRLPQDLVSGAGFGVEYVPGATQIATTPGRTLGALVLVPNQGNRPDVYVNVSGSIDGSFLGSGPGSLGSLQTFGAIR